MFDLQFRVAAVRTGRRTDGSPAVWSILRRVAHRRLGRAASADRLDSASPREVHAGGELVGIPAELGDRLGEGEAVGHSGDVGHRRSDRGRLAAGRSRRLGAAVGDEVWPVAVVLDEGPQHRHHRAALGDRARPEVDPLVVARPEGGQSLGEGRRTCRSARCARMVVDQRVDEGAELLAPPVTTPLAHHRRKGVGGHDAAAHRVLEVVADVGDAVGPADHLSLRCGGGRTRPRVVPDAVEGLGAQVEGGQRDVGTPGRVVEAAVEVGGERVLARVATRAVAAVVPEGDRLGQSHVERAGPRDAGGHLGDLERVGQPGALMVVGEDEDLRLAGEAPEGARVQDPVAVALEAGPPADRAPRARVGCRRRAARVAPGARWPSSSSSRRSRSNPAPPACGAGAGVAVAVGEGDARPMRRPLHGRCPRRLRSLSSLPPHQCAPRL